MHVLGGERESLCPRKIFFSELICPPVAGLTQPRGNSEMTQRGMVGSEGGAFRVQDKMHRSIGDHETRC